LLEVHVINGSINTGNEIGRKLHFLPTACNLIPP